MYSQVSCTFETHRRPALVTKLKCITGFPSSTSNTDQSTDNMSGPTTKSQSPCAGVNKQLCVPKSNLNHANAYTFDLWKAVAPVND